LNLLNFYEREWLFQAFSFEEGSNFVKKFPTKEKSDQILVDNGPEFMSQAFVTRCNENDIKIKYIQSGKPVQNAYIVRFEDGSVGWYEAGWGPDIADDKQLPFQTWRSTWTLSNNTNATPTSHFPNLWSSGFKQNGNSGLRNLEPVDDR
jgi:transposase InsO family protein